MPANFTPKPGEYKDLQPFRFWCQKILPLVYDDSLSYYELLCKVVDYLNKTMEDVDTLHTDVDNVREAYSQLQDWVNNYFDSTDFQNKVNKKLDEMTKNGTLLRIMTPAIISETDKWLKANISQETGYALDASLTLANAAAQALKVGNEFKKCFKAGNIVVTSGNTSSFGELNPHYGYLIQGDAFRSFPDTQNITDTDEIWYAISPTYFVNEQSCERYDELVSSAYFDVYALKAGRMVFGYDHTTKQVYYACPPGFTVNTSLVNADYAKANNITRFADLCPYKSYAIQRTVFTTFDDVYGYNSYYDAPTYIFVNAPIAPIGAVH